MYKLTTIDLFENYKDTLIKCGTYLLDEDDEVIEYNIYECFDIDIQTFFHKENLEKLLSNGLINESIKEKSLEIRDLVIAHRTSKDWSIDFFKSSQNWLKIMQLCDRLKNALNI